MNNTTKSLFKISGSGRWRSAPTALPGTAEAPQVPKLGIRKDKIPLRALHSLARTKAVYHVINEPTSYGSVLSVHGNILTFRPQILVRHVDVQDEQAARHGTR